MKNTSKRFSCELWLGLADKTSAFPFASEAIPFIFDRQIIFPGSIVTAIFKL